MQSKNTFFSKKTSINCGGKLIDLSSPKIMAILNITPDSFYDGGRNDSEKIIVQKVERFISEGADFVDIGAYSSRPGAVHVSEEEEIKRLIPVMRVLNKHFEHLHISIDTFRAQVAKVMVEDYGAELINDISGGELDSKMYETIANLNVPYILMHMRGTPQNMHLNTDYKDLLMELIAYFHQKIDSLVSLGINDLIIDPGFGFSKTMEQNFELLNKMDALKMLELPVLVGVSRKSMIYKSLKIEPDQALNGTTVLNTIALQNGANILRVHDVKEAAEAIKLVSKLKHNH